MFKYVGVLDGALKLCPGAKPPTQHTWLVPQGGGGWKEKPRSIFMKTLPRSTIFKLFYDLFRPIEGIFFL